MIENKYYHLIEKLIKTSRLHKRAIESYVDEIGIDRTRHRILMNISKYEFKSQKELAESIGITPAAVTLALCKLEADGLIERKNGSDLRFNQISITEKGEELISNTKRSFAAIDAKTFEGFSEEEISELVRLLEKMEINIDSILRKD